ncbi:HAMP domain-containing protein [Candidatus Poribacteria bacterium]|nr:HAMP domain-containing protein [Candidatus Poribacteria bacterium]
MRKYFIAGLIIILINVLLINWYFYSRINIVISQMQLSVQNYEIILTNSYEVSALLNETEYSLLDTNLKRKERNNLAFSKLENADKLIKKIQTHSDLSSNIYVLLDQINKLMETYKNTISRYAESESAEKEELAQEIDILKQIMNNLGKINSNVSQELIQYNDKSITHLNLQKLFILTLPMIVVVLSILFIIFLFKKIFYPIEKMTICMQGTMKGDYTQRITIHAGHEIGELINFYNRMIEHIQLLLAKEEQSKEEIEHNRKEMEILHKKLESKIVEFSETLSFAAKGDLTLKVKAETSDEMGKLAAEFNSMLSKLSNLIQQVKITSNEVASASGEIVQTSEDINKGIREQSNQLTGTSAAFEELSVAARQISDNTLGVLESTKNTLRNAQEGKQLMNQTISSIQQMRKIAQLTARRILELGNKIQKISEIVKIINEISEQTNLLALNAAIEATRAGEHGKGFAIVADEVSKLAENSSHSANEIKGLIQDIQLATNATVLSMEEETRSSEVGEKLALEMGKTLEHIETLIQDSTMKSKEISLATEQQKIGSEQAAKGMESIVDITRRTSVGSVQTAESAKRLQELANRLNNLISKFKITNNKT